MKKVVLAMLPCAALGLSAARPCRATGHAQYVVDNFNDGLISLEDWYVEVSGIPQGGAAVTEVNGRMELVNRGHLNTVRQLQPGAPGVGELRVAGEWDFGAGIDVMAILTRSDGTPNAGQGFGETSFGLEFQVRAEDGVALISPRTNGFSNVLVESSPGALTNLLDGVFDFEVLDDGTNVSLRVTEQGNPSNTAYVTTTVPDLLAENHVTFHNRHLLLGNNVLYLDNVSITASGTPTPGIPQGTTYFVAGDFVTAIGPTGGAEYDRVTVVVTIDPTNTNWVAWNYNTPGLTAHPSRPGELFFGDLGFGTDDFIRMTVTNPDGTSATVDLDQNNSAGASFGPQNVLFGQASSTPDAMRAAANFSTTPQFFDEAGAFNDLFTVAGDYAFEFSFRNQYTNTGGHPWPVYLIVAGVPEPSSVALAIGLCAGVLGLRRR